MSLDFKSCSLCPRNCGVDRYKKTGVCGNKSVIRAAKAQLHMWEEPCISGKNGAGAVFFSGCSLKCCYCQNYKISHENFGEEISVSRLSDIFLELQDMGADNIDLISPTHFVPLITASLDAVKHRLNIPVIYNCGGYEKRDTLKMLEGYIDIYMPDLKYKSSELSGKYSSAPDYFKYASDAILEMHRQQPELEWNGSLLKKGLIIRHLVLPKCRHDSMDILSWLKENIPADSFKLSLMSQFTPAYHCRVYPELNRKITTLEYNSVVDMALEIGFDGYTQSRKSADSSYTPEFDLTGITPPSE